jgi:hypothetical protein
VNWLSAIQKRKCSRYLAIRKLYGLFVPCHKVVLSNIYVGFCAQTRNLVSRAVCKSDSTLSESACWPLLRTSLSPRPAAPRAFSKRITTIQPHLTLATFHVYSTNYKRRLKHLTCTGSASAAAGWRACIPASSAGSARQFWEERKKCGEHPSGQSNDVENRLAERTDGLSCTTSNKGWQEMFDAISLFFHRQLHGLLGLKATRMGSPMTTWTRGRTKHHDWSP